MFILLFWKSENTTWLIINFYDFVNVAMHSYDKSTQ